VFDSNLFVASFWITACPAYLFSRIVDVRNYNRYHTTACLQQLKASAVQLTNNAIMAMMAPHLKYVSRHASLELPQWHLVRQQLSQRHHCGRAPGWATWAVPHAHITNDAAAAQQAHLRHMVMHMHWHWSTSLEVSDRRDTG
jgi:hypothetical protein